MRHTFLRFTNLLTDQACSKSLTGYTDSFKGLNGTISYDGIGAEELEGELAYLPEDDIHFPLLSEPPFPFPWVLLN